MRVLDVLQVTNGGSPPQLIEVRIRWRAELEGAPQNDVVLRVLADEVGYGAHRDRGRETACLADDPGGHVAAITTPADAHAAAIDAAASLDRLGERGHRIGR